MILPTLLLLASMTLPAAPAAADDRAIGRGSAASEVRQEAAELTLFICPTPHGIDWSTPGTLARSQIPNHYGFWPRKNRRPIGHVNVELVCSPGTPQETRILTGMSNAKAKDTQEAVLKRKLGLGVMLADFPGELETPQEVRALLDARFASGKMSFLTFRIAPKTCRRLARYMAEFKERGVDKVYGLPQDPLKGQGSGCTAFGVSFLEAAGLLRQEFRDRWSRLIRIPMNLIGGPGHPVSLWPLLIPGRSLRWANEGEPHKAVFFWDPDLIHEWIVGAWKDQERSGGSSYKLLRRGKSLGLEIDATAVPAPSGPIFKVS